MSDNNWPMRLLICLAVAWLVIAALYGVHDMVHDAGYNEAKDELPSCLYLMRPAQCGVKPLGVDMKEGIDWYCSEIERGGYFVSLEKWKGKR